ncbi:MmgE/PrpD family protein [Cupriavidus basilensis]|uniref:MmgE/PrpD family protein n=1 Tax=Cupriavidus basilensis TaxID=68895 RepID=A0ABT6AR63_9BURK|nr:MmgE/PrpD family protein [Cupriavidus basilensis]MDF3835109.1 MmgE/PrpD family protein [Cupriavidus basilensis]
MIIDEFAAYAGRAATAPLPDPVLHHARRAVIDWFAALLAGLQMAPGQQLVAAHRAELGVGKSTIIGHATPAFPATAAWINGSTSHAAEFDDIFRDAVYHPGCPTIAAALALAEQVDATGIDLLRAVIAGYEVSTRIGAAVQPAHYRFFHTTGTVGCFGAAAAGALLLSPGDVRAAADALATAATFASGLQQAFRSDAMTKALHAGHAAQVGVQAAQAAAHGVNGVHDILEGDAGFGAALCGKPDWHGVTDGLGTDYHIMRITQKNHGCCGHTFAAIDAAMRIVRNHRLDPARIAAIRVATYQAALDVTGNFRPATAFEARFSLPYVVAHGLLHGAVRLDAFQPDRLADPAIRALMTKVALSADPDLTAAFPRQRAARVEIEMADGSRHAHFAPYRHGDPESPLDDATLADKFMELGGPVLGASPAARLLEALWQLDHRPVRALGLSTLRAG